MAKNKYNAKKCIYKGIPFDSEVERDRYIVLEGMRDEGLISDLKPHVKYQLLPSQRIDGKVVEREVSYIADFVYTQSGEEVVEDVKGYRNTSSSGYAKFVIKKKMLLYFYGLRVREIVGEKKRGGRVWTLY